MWRGEGLFAGDSRAPVCGPLLVLTLFIGAFFFIGSPPALKTSALVSMTQGNAYMTEMQIGNG